MVGLRPKIVLSPPSDIDKVIRLMNEIFLASSIVMMPNYGSPIRSRPMSTCVDSCIVDDR